MINKLFPYRVQLHIFQLDEYNAVKFLLWIHHHFFVRTVENKKALVWTEKAKAIISVAIFLTLLCTVILLLLFGLIGFFIGILLATQAYIFLLLAYLLLLPYERYAKQKMKTVTLHKLATLKNLTVIGVTGSYGKTSVKEYLYHILRSRYAVLKTPESYNTPYGIAKVVDLELDQSYTYFICEMGAYKVGDIKEICEMVHPTHGILTGINEQHIETFGSLENTTKGKFELIDSLPKNGNGVVNKDNQRIQNALPQYGNKHLVTYGFTDEKYTIRDIQQTENGTFFTLVLDGNSYKTKTKLFGKVALQNILAAGTMSYLLGMKPDAIVAAIATIKPVAHRLEIKEMRDMTLIDDAYNSNVDGFKEAISLLSTYKRPKVFVTPGIVDLGSKTESIHKELGSLMEGIDYIFLVGRSERTDALSAGITDKTKIRKVTSLKEVWEKIDELKLQHPVVLLENDLPDNY